MNVLEDTDGMLHRSGDVATPTVSTQEQSDRTVLLMLMLTCARDIDDVAHLKAITWVKSCSLKGTITKKVKQAIEKATRELPDMIKDHFAA